MNRDRCVELYTRMIRIGCDCAAGRCTNTNCRKCDAREQMDEAEIPTKINTLVNSYPSGQLLNACGSGYEHPCVALLFPIAVQLEDSTNRVKEFASAQQCTKKSQLLSCMRNEGKKSDFKQKWNDIEKTVIAQLKEQQNKNVIHIRELANQYVIDNDVTGVLYCVNLLARYTLTSSTSGTQPCPLCLSTNVQIIHSHVSPNAQLKLLSPKWIMPHRSGEMMSSDQVATYLLCEQCEHRKENPGELYFLQLSKTIIEETNSNSAIIERTLSAADTSCLHHYAAGLFFAGMLTGVDLLDIRSNNRFFRLLALDRLHQLRNYLLSDTNPTNIEPWTSRLSIDRPPVSNIGCFVFPDIPIVQSTSKRIHRDLFAMRDPQLVWYNESSPPHLLLYASSHFFHFTLDLFDSAFLLKHNMPANNPVNIPPFTINDHLLHSNCNESFTIGSSLYRACCMPTVIIDCAEQENERRSALLSSPLLTDSQRQRFDEAIHSIENRILTTTADTLLKLLINWDSKVVIPDTDTLIRWTLSNNVQLQGSKLGTVTDKYIHQTPVNFSSLFIEIIDEMEKEIEQQKLVLAPVISAEEQKQRYHEEQYEPPFNLFE